MIALAALAAIGWGASDFLGGLSRSQTLVFSILVVSELLGAAMIVPAIAATGAPHWDAHLLLACVAGIGVTVEFGVVYWALSIGAAFITALLSERSAPRWLSPPDCWAETRSPRGSPSG